MQEADLAANLSSRAWRLNNLYRIVDKHGSEVTFRMNWFQQKLYEGLHYLNIILKARQVGITTFVCILFLDDCLFSENIGAAIIADTREHAQKIFETKIKFPFDHLPEELRKQFAVNTDTAQRMSFANGSSIETSTSVRSGTIQRLHISEFGKICAKDPSKAAEIVTGSLNTVTAGEVVTIESTAEGQFGFFYDYCQEAKRTALSASLTSMDYKLFFFPWWRVDEYVLSGTVNVTKDYEDYFKKLEDEEKITLATEQKNWYVKKATQQGEYMQREYPGTFDEAFASAIEGSYYGKLMDQLRFSGHIKNLPHDPKLLVDTYWDLGINDDTVVLFVQQLYGEVRVIDSYASSGEGLQHYMKVLDTKREKQSYRYRYHSFPFDIEVKDLSTGKERKWTLTQMGMLNEQIVVLPKLGIADGIDAVRSLLPTCYFDQSKCDGLVKALQSYRKEWDDKHGVFKSQPYHDEFSHYADAFRQLAVGVRNDVAPNARTLRAQDEALSGTDRFQIVSSF